MQVRLEISLRAMVVVLTRGGDYQIMEGTDHFTRFIIAEFPDKQSAINCFESKSIKMLHRIEEMVRRC